VFLNLTGALTGRRMLGWWRGMIMGITVFAAVATPSTDPLTMLALAGPIWVLYFGAVLFSLLNDRRRQRRDELGPDDDEASELDLTPEAIGEVEAVPTARALPEQATTERVNGYDDVT
jgi:sec-independent protein translocase protein TatC